MNGGLTASPSASCQLRIPSKFHHSCSRFVPFRSFSSNLAAAPRGSSIGSRKFSRFSLRCNSSTNSGGPSGQENETKNVLDAFFLGKALAEALNERIESSVGEFLSMIGRLQAEQQKQVQDFQKEVLERAQKAKEKAAQEAMEAEGLIHKSPKQNVSTASIVVASGTTSAVSNSATAENSSITSAQPTTESPNASNDDPRMVISDED